MLGKPWPKFDQFQPNLVKINQTLSKSKFMLTWPRNPSLLFDTSKEKMHEHLELHKPHYHGERKRGERKKKPPRKEREREKKNWAGPQAVAHCHVAVRLGLSQHRPIQHEIVRFGPRARTRTSQEITRPSTAPAWVRLTSEFLRFPRPHGFKRPHAKLIQGLTYKPRVRTWIFLMRANGDSPFEARGWHATPHG